MGIFEDFDPSESPQDTAEYGTVTIDRTRVPAAQVTPINLGRFQSKFTYGDPTADSDDLLSTWAQTSWRGGGQKLQLIEGSDDERWWDSTIQTEYPEALTLPDKTHSADFGDTSCFPVGDYNAIFYVAFDANLYRWDVSAATRTLIGEMGAAPSDHGVVYLDVLYIPNAGSGYTRYNANTAEFSTLTDIQPRSFALWDGRLHALDINGRLCVYDETSGWDVPDTGTWAGRRMALPSGESGRRLAMFHNRSGEPALHIGSDRAVWAYQAEVPRIYPTGLEMPPHPEQSLGFASWRTENLYLTAGVGVYAYNGTTVAAVGLDRNDGLPARLRGTIVDLTPEHNALLALVRGTPEAPDPSDDIEGEGGMYEDVPLRFAPIDAASSLWALTTGGWHCRWQSTEAGTPTASYVSVGDGAYTLFWGFGGALYWKRLRKEFHTPEQAARVGVDEFDPTGYLITGQFDANMKGFDKLASHFEVYLKDARETGESTGTVRVSYRTDRNTGWRVLGEATEPGKTVLPFPLTTENGVYEGEAFGWIQFRYDLIQPETHALDVSTLTPVVEAFVLKLVKVPLTGRSWEIQVPLMFDGAYFGISPDEIREKLNTLVTEARFIRFVHKDINTRVLVAQVTGSESTGEVPYGMLRVSVLEVTVPDHPVTGGA